MVELTCNKTIQSPRRALSWTSSGLQRTKEAMDKHHKVAIVFQYEDKILLPLKNIKISCPSPMLYYTIVGDSIWWANTPLNICIIVGGVMRQQYEHEIPSRIFFSCDTSWMTPHPHILAWFTCYNSWEIFVTTFDVPKKSIGKLMRILLIT